MKQFLVKMLSDDKGNISSLRFMVALFLVNFIIVWDIMCFMQGAFLPFDFGSVVALIGLLGVKAFQKKSENKWSEEEKDDSDCNIFSK